MLPARENGDLAINHPQFLWQRHHPSRIDVSGRGGKWLEDEVVIELTNNERMGEKSPNISIVVCGRVDVVGGVGGTKYRQRAGRIMVGANTAI